MINLREKLGLFLTLVTFSFCCPNPVTASSLLAVCDSFSGNTSNCPKSDIYFPVYKKVSGVATFNYKIDQGPLGELSADEAYNDSVDVLNLWEAESSLDFVGVDGGRLDEDVDDTNFEDYLESSSSLGYSPVIWDDDGSITEALAGSGSKNSVLGFAGASFFTVSGGRITGIKESQSAFNGFLFDGDNTGDSPSVVRNLFLTTILHEFGHMFGFDHTQGGNLKGFNDGIGDLNDVPVMFPIAANPLVELQQDDIAIAREAYPKGDEDTLYGRITGNLTTNGKQVKGLNVVAFKVDDDNPRKKAIACPTDVDGQGTGKFILPNLVPGEYIIFAEKIDSDFTGGSSVGIHDPASSFTSVFYNGDDQNIIQSSNLDTGINQALHLTVNAGSTTNIKFETNPTVIDNGDNGTSASFIAKGRAVNKATYLKTNKSIKVKLKLVNLNPGTPINLQLSTDYPDLVQFLPSGIVSFSGKSKIINVRYASYNIVKETFPEIIDGETVNIPLTIEDLDNDLVDDSTYTLSVF